MSTLEGGAWQAAGGYLEHLSDADLALLGSAAGSLPAERLRGDPAMVERLLDHPRTFQAVFGGTGRADPLLRASPFLVFALAIQRGAEDLREAAFVGEWAGPRQRLPVFDAATLRDFLAAPARRLFLAELLASYVHVASGSVLVQTRRGWRRQRFSELDPVRLAALLDVVPAGERVGIYRRLGDLALFLTGVLPDHTATRAFAPVDAQRLLRHAGLEGVEAGRPGSMAEPAWGSGGVALLERLGRRWYRLAYLSAPVRTAPLRVMDEVAERFDQARRILNLVTTPTSSHSAPAGSPAPPPAARDGAAAPAGSRRAGRGCSAAPRATGAPRQLGLRVRAGRRGWASSCLRLRRGRPRTRACGTAGAARRRAGPCRRGPCRRRAGRRARRAPCPPTAGGWRSVWPTARW